jgi:outer membrane protein insertion porin family/translocation and assembly module TamA
VTRIRLVVLGLLGATVIAGPLHGQSTRDREVTDLSFQGNEAFSNGELSAVIETQATECRTFILQPFCWLTDWGFAHDRSFLEEDELPIDLLRLRVFYRQRGFREVSVDTLVYRQNGRVGVAFLIDEGSPTPLDSLSIVGVEGILDTATVRRQTGLEAGSPFDRVALEQLKDLLVTRLQNLGYIDAVVLEDAFLPPRGGARVTLITTPGQRYRIGDIRIEGADEIGPDVVERFLSFQPGQFYSQDRILNSQRTLAGLPAIRFAAIGRADSALVPGDSLVNINVIVTPAPTRAARAGGGWSTDRCFQIESRLTHRNFFGEARALELTARLSNLFADPLDGQFPCQDVGQDPVFHQLNFLLQLQYSQPYFFSPRTSFSVQTFAERESVPDVFVRNAVGSQVTFTRQLRRRMTASLSYRPEFTGFDEKSADIFFCVNFGFCQTEDIQFITESAWLSPITLSWLYNRTDDPFAPAAGYYLAAEAELAESFTGSQWRYGRLTVQAANFQQLSPGLVFAARARAGFVESTRGFAVADTANDVIYPGKRFFAGGAQSVRGFGQNLLGPTVLVLDSIADCPELPLPDCSREIAATDPGQFVERPIGGDAVVELSLELRRSLGNTWRFVGFLDIGQVWESVTEPRAPIWSPGVGIRYQTPVGPLRLDLGYNLSGVEIRPVVATLPDGSLVELDDPVAYDPFTFDNPSLLTEFFRRLRLNLAIGEAF